MNTQEYYHDLKKKFIILNRINKKSNIGLQINSLIKAIDTEDIEKITTFINNNNFHNNINYRNSSKRDIVFEIFYKKLLTSERLKFIIKNCHNSLYISSFLIKELIKDNNDELLKIIYDNFKFYDNSFIKWLLVHYANQAAISTSDLNKKISNKKYKISKLDKLYYRPKDQYLLKTCHDNNEYLVKYLVVHGADVNREDIYAKTPLFYACENGCEHIAKYLIEHGADINKESNSRDTPLISAFKGKNLNIINYLIELGVDINTVDLIGNTPLFYACQNGYQKIVKCLIEKGVDINKENYSKDTPLIYACKNGNEIISKYLIEHGAEINKENNKNDTPLIYASKNGNEVLVKY